MPQPSINETGLITLKASAAIREFRRVKLNTAGDKYELAGATDRGIGTTEQRSDADGDKRAVRLNNFAGTRFAVTAGAASVGSDAYTAANGKVSKEAAAGSFRVGRFLTAHTADDDICEIDWEEPTPADVITLTAGGALTQFARVKFSAGKMAVAVLADKALGTTEDTATADGDKVRVRPRNSSVPRRMIANGAIAVAAEVFSAAAGKVGATATGAFREGIALTAAAADNDVIWVMPDPGDNAAS